MKSRLKDTLLLIGTADSDRSRLHDIFAPNYYLLETETARQGIMLLEQNSACIAAVLADIPLTSEEDLRLLVAACQPGTENEIPVILFITPTGTGSNEELAFLIGAADVVLKPYTTLSAQRRVQVLVDLYAHRWHLEQMVEDQNETIRSANQTILDTLAAIIEHRSAESGNHVLRIRQLTRILLQEVAICCPEYELNDTLVDLISSAATLHDIGKISVPDSILNKPGRLTPEEMAIMQTHTQMGSQMVEHLEKMGDLLYLRYAYNICLFHHERWDGSGYPKGLKGDQIPICAQVVGLSDAFDALTTHRVYKPAYDYETAINMILNGECGAFSPKLLECFKRVRNEMVEQAKEYASGHMPRSDEIRVPLPEPEQKTYALDATQLSQLKYQALLHHVNDTIMELDIDSKVYHVVYNPNPDFVSMLSNASFDEIGIRLMSQGIHPDDVDNVAQLQRLFAEKLFAQNLRKTTFRCRIFNPAYNEAHPYEVTLIRVNTENPAQRIVLAVFHNLRGEPDTLPTKTEGLLDSPALYDLRSSCLCCRNDDRQTILEGGHTLLHLTGHTAADLQTRLNNSLWELVLPEDRHILAQNLSLLRNSTGKQECRYRIRHQNGQILWVTDRSRLYFHRDGAEYIYHALSDITACKQEQAQLEAIIARNRVVINQTEGVIFEWDLEADTVTFSEKWAERFGYQLVSTKAAATIRHSSHFHPDDMPVLRDRLEALLQASQTTFAEARILTREGRYLWSRIRATSVFNDKGAPTHIIGIIHDIHELKTSALRLQQEAQQDSLTKLLNKASTQQAVSAYLDSDHGQNQAALLVLDLDNFKAVNDNYGHLYGDAVLTQISATLRSLFRWQDVIGRIGGDEFLIFMKDIPSPDMVIDRCDLLVSTFFSQLRKLMPDIPVSVSIGCAMHPAHGNSYAELFRRADDALYLAKRRGKNRYAIFNTQDAYEALTDTTERTTHIDSDSQPTMNDDSMVRFVFQCLYESRDIDATIQELLSFIGSRFNVSRVYIFENNEDNTCCSNTFEWCNTGITPQKDDLQNLSYIDDIPGWPEVYDEKGVFYCTDITKLKPQFREILEPQGIKSMLHSAIMDRGVFRGYVGFDECTSHRLWTQGQVDLLEFLAQVLAVFLIKERSQDKHTQA